MDNRSGLRVSHDQVHANVVMVIPASKLRDNLGYGRPVAVPVPVIMRAIGPRKIRSINRSFISYTQHLERMVYMWERTPIPYTYPC